MKQIELIIEDNTFEKLVEITFAKQVTGHQISIDDQAWALILARIRDGKGFVYLGSTKIKI